MMKSFFYLISILLIFTTCSIGTKEVKEEKNVIHLAEAIENPVKMNLSEIVDSIAFVPISSKEAFIRDPQLISYSKPYLMVYPGCVFNMQGQFVGPVGSVGQGPGEESNIDGYGIFYDEQKDLFYTISDKVIQFDNKRKFTGKEVRIVYRDKNNSKLPHGLKSPYAFLRAGEYNVLINYPDSAYWMDENLQIVKKQRIIPENLFLSTRGGMLVHYNNFTYNDTTMFFNCFTDEISSVTEEGFTKRWKIDLGEEKADNRCFLNGLKKLYEDEMFRIIRSSEGNPQAMKNMAENSRLAELIDGKRWIAKAWETDRYVMAYCSELMAFQEWRTGNTSMTRWAIHDKQMGDTKVIKRLVNDMDGCVDLTPSSSIIGINDGVLMTAVWPYEVYSYVQRKKEKGEPVDPRLEKLLVDYDEEDNPILFLYYLKK